MTETMKSWTVDEMLTEDPCDDYTREVVTRLWAGRESLSLLSILDLDIPDEDKVWVAYLPNAFDKQEKWINKIIDRAVRDHALTEPSTKEWAENWLSGVDRTTTSAARAARASAIRTASAASATRAAEHKRQVSDLRAILEGK